MTDNKNKTAAIILNGISLPEKIIGDFIICADGCYNLAKRSGIDCGLLIGDLDSVDNSVGAEIEIKRFPKIKDMSDGEIAVQEAKRRGFGRIIIYGADGGRPDHAASNVNLLLLARSLKIDAKIACRDYELYYLTGNISIKTKRGDTVSIIPVTATAHATTSKGLLYPLDGLTFKKRSSHGISNIALSDEITISLKNGAVFVYVVFN